MTTVTSKSASVNMCCGAESGEALPTGQASNSQTDQALDVLISKWTRPVSQSGAAAHKQALEGLAQNYAALPKDNNGYVTIGGLQQVANNPGDYPPGAVKAARYFLAHPAKFAALETSRERHQEGVVNQDGEFSKEDIYNELANPDSVKPGHGNIGSSGAGVPAERYPSTPAPFQLDPDAMESIARKASDNDKLQALADSGLRKETAEAPFQLDPDAMENIAKQVSDNDTLRAFSGSGLRKEVAGAVAGWQASRVGNIGAQLAAAAEVAPATAAPRFGLASVQAAAVADVATQASKEKVDAQADPATAAATVTAVITGGAKGMMSYDDLQKLADGNNPQFPPDKFPELQAAAKTMLATPKFREHYADSDGNFKTGDLADWVRNSTQAKIDPNNLTPEQQKAYAAMDANDPKLRYKNGDPTPAYNLAVGIAGTEHNADRAGDLAAGYGDSPAERKRAMNDLGNSDALFGRGDGVATISELRTLANGTGHGVTATKKEIEAAKMLVAYYDANGGKGGKNALATASGSDEKFSKKEWAAAVAGMPA
ncbi:MAG: hypothetical protein H7234_09850 [Herminiimonas sp.]|nr:hypothetical protein [Herminiimonas sp.]